MSSTCSSRRGTSWGATGSERPVPRDDPGVLRGEDAGRASHTLAQGDFTEVFTWAQAAQHASPVMAVDDLDLAVGDHIKAVAQLTRPNDLVAGLEAHPRHSVAAVHL